MGGPEITNFLTLDHPSLYGSPVPMYHASLDGVRHKKVFPTSFCSESIIDSCAFLSAEPET